jgi:site-specific DNA-adenine methylase
MKQLHPFFSYFGSKYRLAKYYPEPQCDEIIEAFAGSAGYALMYPEKRVYLYEIYEPIVTLWKWLIEKATPEEILALPVNNTNQTNKDGKPMTRFHKDHPIESEVNCEAARILMGFWVTESQTNSSRYPLSKSRGGNWTQHKKEMVANQLQYIRHWKVEKLSFEQIPNRKATWFIDPPYEDAGSRYRHNKIDYKALGQWCNEREGQVIVCEQNSAKWLEFQHLRLGRNASNKDYRELVWHKGIDGSNEILKENDQW